MTTATKTKRPVGADWVIPAPDLKAALTATAPAVQRNHATFAAVRLGAFAAEAFNGELRVSVDMMGADFEPFLVPHERLVAIASMAVGDATKANATIDTSNGTVKVRVTPN